MPLNKLTPPIAKIMKKNISTITVFFKSSTAVRADETRSLSPRIVVTAFNGLSTRKALSDCRESPASSSSAL